ncbi:Putative multidrug export ATP-binding/permease protein [Rosistilla oblonga]|uniref:ABC transporter ATP-binding protein n=1 Tax=Rosistilla oblonga TaxID=2527990 RepID=UPI00118CA373|nr:ABC transporter ATP-binding protein [Rosistilla oblonga]QDV15184.1 Putative multidrug export ATP-binding/permease protein [Rosistilla oblonga]
MHPESSRQRFDQYRQEFREKRSSGGNPHSASPSPHSDRGTNRQRSFFQLFTEFWGLLGRYRGRVILGLATLSVATLLRLVPPAATKLAIDCVLTDPAKPMPGFLQGFAWPEEKMSLLVAIALGAAFFTACATVIQLWGRWLATKTVNQVQISIRRKVFDHAIRLPLTRVYKLKSGGAASLIREDAGGIADLIFSMLYNPWRAIIQFVGSLIILMLVDWKLMLGGLLLLPGVYITHRTWINRIRPMFKDIRKQRQHIDAGATETFGGIRIVRTFARARSESNRFVREGTMLVRQQLFTWWWSRAIEIIWEVVIPLASTGLLLYGGSQIINGELTLGDLMMFLVYLTMLLDPIAALAGSAVTFQNNLAGLDRVLDVLESPRELPTNPTAVSLRKEEVAGAITLENVGFHYPDTESMVLQDVCLEIQPGQTVALVGRSGAGKTTLTNLIARFYDPVSGAIRLDGRDLRDIRLESFRKLLGIVEQDVFLFDGTIRDNIGYARRDASLAEVQAAAQAAAAAEFIEKLPEGYESWIGERGVKLSGGQRQRLAIARAILADPKILILDEATSNLDSESERLIQDSLGYLLQNRTSIVIAHRLSTIIHADKIVVMEEGRVVQVGTHQELMSQNGRYQEMVHLQMEPLPHANGSATGNRR